MKNYLIALMVFLHAGAYADWLPAAQAIPMGTSTGVTYDVITTYDSVNQIVVAAWRDSGANSTAYYAVYDGTTWITPGTPIPLNPASEFPTTGVNHNINLTYDEATATVIAAWRDRFGPDFYYAVFDGSSWTTGATYLPLVTSNGIYNDIYLAYNASNQTVVATWEDSGDFRPYYAVFDGTSWTTAGEPIPPGASVNVGNDVTVVYNAADQTIIAAWADYDTQAPYYAVFDGSSWTTGLPIPNGTSNGVKSNVGNVNLVYNPAYQTVIAAWADSVNSLPYYSVFDGTSWTPGATIALFPGINVTENIFMSFNSISQTVMAAWSNTAHQAFYSIFNGAIWTTAARIPVAPSQGIDYNVFLVFDPASGQMVATWGNYLGNPDGFFNIFAAPVVLAPPATLTVNDCSLNFATQYVWINKLTWTPSPSPDVVAYNIYRNGAFITQVNATTFQYTDSPSRLGANSYGVTSIASDGSESLPITATITSNRKC